MSALSAKLVKMALFLHVLPQM